MKTLVTAIALTAALSTPVFASDDQEQHQGSDMKGATMQGGMMDKETNKMHEHMEEMEKLMAKIKKEDSPQKREQLMQEHMKSMDEGMRMMNSNMRGKHGTGGGMGMAPSQHMDMMEKRLDMMQRMMDQMMQENAEERNLHKDMRKS